MTSTYEIIEVTCDGCLTSEVRVNGKISARFDSADRAEEHIKLLKFNAARLALSLAA